MPEHINDDIHYHVNRLGDSSWAVEHRGSRVACVEHIENVPDSYAYKGKRKKNRGELCVIGYIITHLEGAPEKSFSSPQEAVEAAAYYHLNSSVEVRLNAFQKVVVSANRLQDDIFAAASCDKLQELDQECLLMLSKQLANHRKLLTDVFGARFQLADVPRRPDEMTIIVSDS
ncbi:MAG: hypothetical protein Q7U72_08285 [Brevundimonas sp.]|uniref:hypothetical protein n=1 Tax=Brevundimonas sp. TaxID=1871086 RepID=UPI00272403AD|nr:hypothetical protein [Brevundimonas sp.]MDO9077432.1 hypothetical protein [Brevundimonas sp.]MDZ4062680.1 hypothetical protein [Brevundimonas sp.]